MNYQEAKDIRNKSYISNITEKLIAGHGLGSSIKQTISEKSKARSMDFKEKFDPLNIAKFMTGGSKLAPALLGRMMGRSQQDIKYFSGNPKVREERNKATKIDKLETDNQILNTLLQIYQYMKKTHEDEVSSREKKANQREEIELEKEKRHKELIEAITGKKDGGKTVTATPIKEPEKEGGLFGAIFSAVAAMIEKALSSLKTLVESISGMIKEIIGAFGDLGKLLSVGRLFAATGGLGAMILGGLPMLALGVAKELAEKSDIHDKDSWNPFTKIGRFGASQTNSLPEQMKETREKENQLVPESDMKGRPGLLDFSRSASAYDARKKRIEGFIKEESRAFTPEEVSRIKTAYGLTVPQQLIENEQSKTEAPTTKADVKPVTTVPTEKKLEVMPSVPPSEELNAKVKESVTLNLPSATPKSVKESQVINNTNVVNTNKPMAPRNPLPSVRNTEKSFSEMIFYSTRVV